jgi:hypothetical protein
VTSRSQGPIRSGGRSTASTPTRTATTAATTAPTTRSTDLSRALRTAALVAPVYVAAAILTPGGLFRERRFRDVGVYGDYANALLDGRIPYRDFFVEYPPGGFLVFTPPALLPDGWYLQAFKTLMAVVWLATLVLVALVLLRLGASTRRLYGVLGALALSPLVIGPVALNTYDIWPAFLVLAAVAALLDGRDAAAFVLLAVAVAAKLYAAALLPLFVVSLWRRKRPLRLPLTAFFLVAIVIVGPFALLGWDGLVESVRAQAGRALQIESTAAAVLLAADRLGVYDAQVVHGSTAALSRDLAGSLPDAVAAVTSIVQVAAVILVAFLFARGRADGQRFVVATAATLAGFLAFARFVSPQYLLWLVPVVPLAGAVAGLVLAAALLLGRLWFFHYRDVFALEGIVWLVVLRDLLVVVLYLVLLRTMIPSSSKTFRHEPLPRSRASGTAVVEDDERRSR